MAAITSPVSTYAPNVDESYAPANSSHGSSMRHGGIHIVVPRMAVAGLPTPTTTPTHGHTNVLARVDARRPASQLTILDTPTHGHGDVVSRFVVPSMQSLDSPMSPSHPRPSARASRWSGMFSDAADAQQQALSPTHMLFDVPHSPLMTSPLESEEHSVAGQDGEAHDSGSAQDSNALPREAEDATFTTA
ncbi:hypothetical protein BV20DRAFT_1055422 [Pilatotrama ljubarskyi]|nr:hypothetical protein BV20DRAFT_1055422 [Pilatotrama ljubarskyi]